MNSIRVAIYIVCGAISAILLALVLIQKSALDQSEAELETSRAANLQLTKTVETLIAQRAVDDRIVTEFTKGLAELKAASDEQNRTLSELEKNDPAVKDYLSIPIPHSLGELFNYTDPASGDKGNTP